MKCTQKSMTLALLVFVGFAMTGCETVEPYQKGNLAKYEMKADRDSLESVMSNHVTFSREASSGGEGVGGGGCGCN